MKFLFDDASFSFETLRAAGFAAYGGADLGEVLVTAAAITDGDEDGWLRAWTATAERVHAIGDAALAAGHRVSAREALLRASNYYRTAEFFRRVDPANDPVVTDLSTRSRTTFAAAAALFDTPVEAVAIPYEGTTLPGYLFLVDGSGAPRPTVVFTSGYDSTLEEAWFAIAAAAVRRGYNVLAFDGPGQGAALREQGLVFRPDWEAVITPVVDYALTRPEIAADRIALFGYSLGGYLVARAAAFEHRLAAVILDDGVHDFSAAFASSMPPFLWNWIQEGRDDVAVPVATLLTHVSTQVRWALNNGVWALGADGYADLVRKAAAYTLDGVADRITAPTLILDAENDQFFNGQPQQVEKALVNAPTTLVTFSAADGGGEHCHMGAMAAVHQTIFDWIDEIWIDETGA
ncbi:alpha/beta hydrolase family protein [Pseudonocardia sp. GCM10023141]|uniref:alpha/beta hydrolase family protein n=1 Tax=Pseudonocardia sp. GCM10023141 TaxID=3252653 RepID=UPI003621B470